MCLCWIINLLTSKIELKTEKDKLHNMEETVGQKENEVKRFKVRTYTCLHCTINVSICLAYSCTTVDTLWPLYINYLFQADLQAEEDKVHSMEKAALQKDNELEQCKVCTHKCICSTGVYKLPAYTPPFVSFLQPLHCFVSHIRLY